MALDRKSVISLAKQSGFTGDVKDATAVKSHIQSELDAGSVFNAGGETLTLDTFDTAWAKVQTVTVSTVKPVEESVVSKGRNPNASIIGEEDEGGKPARFTIGNIHKAAYKSKIARGQAAFPDADMAEAFGAKIRSLVMHGKDYEHAASDREIVNKAQAGQTNTAGGALVPIQFMDTLIYLTEQYGVARKLATVWKMNSDTMVVPRQTAIAAMQYVGENSAITDRDASFDNVQLVARKAAFLTKVPRELMQDSAINIADRIARNFAEAQAIGEDQAYFLGDGTSTYGTQEGLIAALPAGAYINASGGTWASVTSSDIFKIMGSVENVNANRLKFVCSRQFFVQVMMRIDKAASQFKELTTGNLDGVSATWNGYPVMFSQVMPTATAATSKCLYFGDFEGATAFGDRQALEVATNDSVYFASDQIAIRGITRFNTVIHGDGRGSTVGPVASLVTT